jgi:hypothetical protein
MPNSWSKEDRVHYENSEVWQELEKHIIDTVHRAEILQKKIAETVDQGDLNILKEYNKEREKGKQLDQDANAVNDDEVAEDGMKMTSDADDAANDQELQHEVVDDLRSLAKAAIEEGNIKLAYKIERTIDEILEQEVTCV